METWTFMAFRLFNGTRRWRIKRVYLYQHLFHGAAIFLLEKGIDE